MAEHTPNVFANMLDHQQGVETIAGGVRERR